MHIGQNPNNYFCCPQSNELLSEAHCNTADCPWNSFSLQTRETSLHRFKSMVIKKSKAVFKNDFFRCRQFLLRYSKIRLIGSVCCSAMACRSEFCLQALKTKKVTFEVRVKWHLRSQKRDTGEICSSWAEVEPLIRKAFVKIMQKIPPPLKCCLYIISLLLQMVNRAISSQATTEI